MWSDDAAKSGGIPQVARKRRGEMEGDFSQMFNIKGVLVVLWGWHTLR
jgi:hypothetical protein